MVLFWKCLIPLQYQDLRRVIIIPARLEKTAYQDTRYNSIFKVQTIFLKPVLAYQEEVWYIFLNPCR